jgi:hypothetical protein
MRIGGYSTYGTGSAGHVWTRCCFVLRMSLIQHSSNTEQ